jgi:branched-subunit amino acid transport protein
MWAAVLIGSLCCYLLKLAGMLIPQRILDSARVQRLAGLAPVALLTALIAMQTFSSGRHLGLDARAGGLCAAAVLILLRAPFLLVVAGAVAMSALLHLA